MSAIFWAIQYSLPLSLGLLGALSFVRFRTPVKKPEDVAFILLVIALSLLSSVFRFYAAGILLGVVFVVVVVKAALSEKRLSAFFEGKNVTAFVSTTSKKVEEFDSGVRSALGKEFPHLKGGNVVLNDVVQKETGFSLRYSLLVRRHDGSSIPRIIETLSAVPGLDRVEVFHGKAEA